MDSSNPLSEAARALGRKGGPAAAKALGKRGRKARAKKASQTRWAKHRAKKPPVEP